MLYVAAGKDGGGKYVHAPPAPTCPGSLALALLALLAAAAAADPDSPRRRNNQPTLHINQLLLLVAEHQPSRIASSLISYVLAEES
jgi:hypothetical protein